MQDYWEKYKQMVAGANPSAPSVPAVNPADFDVHVSDNTVTQNGNQPTMAAPSDEPAYTPPSFDATPPAVPAETPKEAPTKVSDDTIQSNTGKNSHEDILKMFQASGGDAQAHADLAKRHDWERKMSLIPQAIAGVGDAMAAGVNAGYHANLTTDTQGDIRKGVETNNEARTKDLDNRLMDDPNSDVSKQYQASAAKAFQLMGMKVDPANVGKWSANQIKANMPNIDKLAGIQATKDAKEVQMKMLQNQKDAMLDQRKQGTMVRLSSSLGSDKELNDIKTRVDNIERAYPALDMAKTPQDLTEAGIATLRVINPNGMIGSEALKQYLPRTVGLDSANIIQWITNNPQDAHVQGFLNRYKMLMGRESAVVKDQYQRAFERKVSSVKPVLDANPDMAMELYHQWGVSHPKYNPDGANVDRVVKRPGSTPAPADGKQGDPLGLR